MGVEGEGLPEGEVNLTRQNESIFLSGDVLPLYLILVFLHYVDQVQMDRKDSISRYSIHFKEGKTLHYNTQQEYDELIKTKLNVLIVQTNG
jgi:hypothetical protein